MKARNSYGISVYLFAAALLILALEQATQAGSRLMHWQDSPENMEGKYEKF